MRKHEMTAALSTIALCPRAPALEEATTRPGIANTGRKEGPGFDDGVREAKAHGGNDKRARVGTGSTTGKAHEAGAPSRLNEDEVRARLMAHGFEAIRDAKFDERLWEADARNARDCKLDLPSIAATAAWFPDSTMECGAATPHRPLPCHVNQKPARETAPALGGELRDQAPCSGVAGGGE